MSRSVRGPDELVLARHTLASGCPAVDRVYFLSLSYDCGTWRIFDLFSFPPPSPLVSPPFSTAGVYLADGTFYTLYEWECYTSQFRITRAAIAEETAANPPSPSLPENLYATTTMSMGGGATEATTEVDQSTGTTATAHDDDDWHSVASNPDGGAPVSSSASTEGVPDPFFDSIPVVEVSSRDTSHISLDSRDSSRSARSLLSMLSAARQAQNGRRPRQSTLIPFLQRCQSAPPLRRF
jgi:hypothetical protein